MKFHRNKRHFRKDAFAPISSISHVCQHYKLQLLTPNNTQRLVTANSVMFHKANTTGTVSRNLPVLCSLLCSFKNIMGIIKLHSPPPLLCLFCKQVINYKQSRIQSRINYTLKALVKLKAFSCLLPLVIFQIYIHPWSVRICLQSNYWVVCGKKSNF